MSMSTLRSEQVIRKTMDLHRKVIAAVEYEPSVEENPNEWIRHHSKQLELLFHNFNVAL